MDERRLDEQVAGHELRGDEAVQPGRVAGHATRHLAPRKEPDPGAHRGEGGVGIERRELEPDAAGVGHVVGVHPHHHLGVAGEEPPVERAGDPLPRPADHAHPPVAPAQLLQDRRGPVLRSVVDGDQRQVAEALAEDGDGGRADGPRGVAGRQQDGGPGHGALASLRSRRR